MTDPRARESPFGALTFLPWNHPWNRHMYATLEAVGRALDLAVEAGVGMIRMDFLWSDLEPQRGRFEFDRYDAIVRETRRRGIGLLGMLQYNAAWSDRAWNEPPDPAAFEAFARRVVRRYQDQIRYWEIWNEPDHPNYWTPQDNLAAYSQLLRRTTKAIKEEDPSAMVLFGGLAQNFTSRLTDLYRQAGKEAFDVINLHPFTDPFHPRRLESVLGVVSDVRNVMAAFQDSAKPIWFTEIGCPGVAAPNESHRYWLGPAPNEEQQAEWLAEIYRGIPARGGVERIFWAFFQDTDQHFGNGIDHFGLLRRDFSPKPAFRAYRDLARGALC